MILILINTITKTNNGRIELSNYISGKEVSAWNDQEHCDIEHDPDKLNSYFQNKELN